MTSRKLAWCVAGALLIAAAVHMACYYPHLPERVASHFGSDGQPNGWSSRGAFIGIYAGLIVVMGGMFMGIALWLPKMPASLVNLPHKDYWLAPERKARTCAFLAEYFLWFSNATIGFLIATMHLTFRVNVGISPKLEPLFWGFFWIYMAFTAVWTLGLLVAFRRPKQRAG